MIEHKKNGIYHVINVDEKTFCVIKFVNGLAYYIGKDKKERTDLNFKKENLFKSENEGYKLIDLINK